MPDTQVIKPDRDFIRKVKAVGGDSVEKCYQCATCSVVCNLAPEDCPFPRKEMIWTQWGLGGKLMTDPDVWLCHQCSDCSVNCPREAKPSDVLAAIRTVAFRYFAFPGFMGKLLASPLGIIPLLLLPIIILGAIVWQETNWNLVPLFQGTVVDFNYFLPHDPTEMLFIIGMIIILTFMTIGLIRFYRGMQKAWSAEVKKGFISALISTVIEIFRHNRFNLCGAARYRQIAHMLVFFGFVCAAIATAWSSVEMLILHKFLGMEGHYPPFPLLHPLKIFGNVGGFAVLIGIVIMIIQRLFNSENAGKASYTMWLFIWITGIVTLSGLLCQFMRIANIGELAYPFYFIHMISVFFLLWYAPYSQLGHMFYRTLAMIFARSIGREARELKPELRIKN